MNDDEDEALWAFVTEDATPIERQKPLHSKERTSPRKPTVKPGRIVERAAPQVEQAVSAARRQDFGVGLDRKSAEKLRKGQMPIEGRLDLHGMTQAQAYEALRMFLISAQAAGQRCVLVITGKGAGADGRRDPLHSGQGVLRRKVPEWLAESSFKSLVLKTSLAQGRHGGEGALYVLLRRNR